MSVPHRAPVRRLLHPKPDVPKLLGRHTVVPQALGEQSSAPRRVVTVAPSRISTSRTSPRSVIADTCPALIRATSSLYGISSAAAVPRGRGREEQHH